MLSNKALLVHVQITQWTGRKLDKRATKTVADHHATQKHAGNYTKKLLPGAVELDRVYTLAGQIRKFFYLESLPWFSDGARIIKGDAFLTFTGKFRKMQAEYNAAVEDFLRIYPSLQAHAQNSLGSLYSAADYPDVTALARKFTCDLKVMPVPDADDFRVGVDDEYIREFKETMESVQKDALNDCYNRLHEVIQKAAQKLADPSAIFKNSLIENIEEICELLPRLNITDDPTLESKRMEVKNLVNGLSPEKLRENSTERQDAASKLAKITRDMGRIMGGK